ncbi:MAG: sugar phosphate nucleotidyltransferase [Lautropia sp.]
MAGTRKPRDADGGGFGEIVGLIPAAGRATRLAPLPCSKELLPIGFQGASDGADRKPKPVSQYLLDRMKLAGARKVFFIARPGKWDIADYYGDGSRLGLQLAYLHVGEPWGPPFTLNQAAPFIGEATVVFGFPDILIDPPDSFTPLIDRMRQTGADVVLGLFHCRADEPGDVVETDGSGRVTSLQTKEERPLRPDHYVCWMFAVWGGRFTRFMVEHCRQLAVQARVRVAADPSAKAPEWPVGAVISAALANGLHVDSVLFESGRFLDVGTPDGITVAGRFPIVWDGLQARDAPVVPAPQPVAPGTS